MNNLVVSIKLTHPDAIMPSYAKPGDAGMDLTAVSVRYDVNEELYVYDTGVSMAIPDGYVGLVFPRSSISKTGLSLANSVGVIDSAFRGSILLKFRSKNLVSPSYKIGERIGQIMIIPRPFVTYQSVQELPSSERGTGGFGSTGA